MTTLGLFSGCIQKDKSFLFHDKFSKIEVLFPAEPITTEKEAVYNYGNLKWTISYVDGEKSLGKKIAFSINYTTYPDSIIKNSKDDDAFISQLIKEGNEMLGGKLLNQTISNIGQYHGRETVVSLRNNQLMMKSRYLLIDNNIYILSVTYTPNNAYDKDTRKFIESVKLLSN